MELSHIHNPDFRVRARAEQETIIEDRQPNRDAPGAKRPRLTLETNNAKVGTEMDASVPQAVDLMDIPAADGSKKT